MKKLALVVVAVATVSSVSPVFAAANMTIVKTCVAKVKKDLGTVGNGSLQATAWIEKCIRGGGM